MDLKLAEEIIVECLATKFVNQTTLEPEMNFFGRIVNTAKIKNPPGTSANILFNTAVYAHNQLVFLGWIALKLGGVSKSLSN